MEARLIYSDSKSTGFIPLGVCWSGSNPAWCPYGLNRCNTGNTPGFW